VRSKLNISCTLLALGAKVKKRKLSTKDKMRGGRKGRGGGGEREREREREREGMDLISPLAREGGGMVWTERSEINKKDGHMRCAEKDAGEWREG
jgi:hypothetical protein